MYFGAIEFMFLTFTAFQRCAARLLTPNIELGINNSGF